jgi:hypothetical protein
MHESAISAVSYLHFIMQLHLPDMNQHEEEDKAKLPTSVKEEDKATDAAIDNPNIIYSLSTVYTSYQNGGNEVAFHLYRTLKQAKAAKNKFVYDWDPDINYDCQDSGSNSDEEHDSNDKEVDKPAKKAKKAPQYDEDGLSFGGREYYCEIREIDLTKEEPDGMIFYTRLNA